MMQCVLSPAQATEQAVMVQKVDLHAPPSPEEDDVGGIYPSSRTCLTFPSLSCPCL